MKQRVISGLVVACVLISSGLIGGLYLYLLIFACSLIGLYEFFKATSGKEIAIKDMMKDTMCTATYVLTVAYYLYILLRGDNISLRYAVLIAIIVLAAVYVLSYPKYKVTQLYNALFAFLYCVVMMSFIFLIRIMPGSGRIYFFAMLVGTSICDVCAYFVGVNFGKHKLAPVLSPKKSIEGSIGGITGSVIVAFLLGYVVLDKLLGKPGYTLQLVVLCFFSAIVSQIGDLFASGIKREHDIKDYGNLIPGHGGIIDRMDSMIYTAPVVYIVASVFLAYF